MQKQQPRADVIVNEEVTIHQTREKFLCNTRNNGQSIKLLSQYLREDGHAVINCEVDTQIVEAALDFTCARNNAIVFTEDTDIFILLLHFWNSDMGEMFMKANKKKNQIQNLVTIRKSAERLNPVIIKNIMFIHAWRGWDSMLVIFNKGKTALMKLKDKGDCNMLDICSIFDKTDVTPQEIGKAGVKLFVAIYSMYCESF